MNTTTVFLALALLLPMGAAQAGNLDDLTMQVMESNDPSSSINEMSLPDFDKSSVDTHRDKRDEAAHSAADSRNEIESSVDDSKHEVADTMDDSRDQAQTAVDDSRDEIKQDIESSSHNESNH